VEIMSLMRDQSAARGIPAIVNIHNVEIARRFATRVVRLSGGAVLFDGAPAMLTDALLKQIYSGESGLDGE
jgi:phosphonate transport system ATP-binding protein